MRRAKRTFYLIVALLLTVAPQSALAQGLRYFYDDLNRLTEVVDANGNVAAYSYDAAGSLLSITRSTSSVGTLAVFGFNPTQAGAGQTVTIQGQGFSTTPSSNTVKFNGVAATVVSATSTTLVATVPAGATTGPISVTVGASTAQGPYNFNVLVVLASITITPLNPSIPAGTSQQFTATGNFSDKSTQNLTDSVTWISSSLSVATISNVSGSQGLMTTKVAGMTTLTATLGAVAGSATLTVSPPALVSIAVFPVNPTVPFGETAQFTATGTYTDGSTMGITASATWSSTIPAVATISNATSSQGVATTLAAGTTTINATLGAIVGSTTLTVPALVSIAVTPATPTNLFGINVQFTATGTFVGGMTDNLTTLVNWSSSNAAVATIGNATGSQGLAMTTVTAGTTTITATLGAIANSSTLTVPALVSIAVTPADATVKFDQTVPFTATGTFTNSMTENLTTLATWSSSNEAVATISNAAGSQGLAMTAATAGTTTIMATLGSVSGSTMMTVSQTTASPPRFALVTSFSGGVISSFAVDATSGVLRPLGYTNVSGFTVSAVDPSGQLLYVVGSTSPYNFGGFTINPNTAALTRIPGPFPPFSSGLDVASSVTVDPTDSFVFVQGSKGVYAYTIGAGGVLTEVSGSPFSGGTGPGSVTVDPLGKYVYVVNANNTISAFAITPGTGTLSAVSGSPFATGSTPASIAIDPTDSFLYVANESGSVSAYTISLSTGALTPVSGSPFAAGTNPTVVKTEPSGKFLYVLDYGASAVSGVTVFDIESGGALSVVSGSPFPVGLAANSMTVDPSGNFLYVTSEEREDYPISCCLNDITMYNIGSSGIVGTSARTFRTRGTATSIAITKGSAPLTFTPKFAYVANQGDNTVSASSINPTTGALTPVTNSPFAAGTGPVSVTTDPLGQFAYVANQDADTISAYTINPVGGALQQTTGSPFLAGSAPASVAVDPSSSFVFAANQTSNNVSAYTIGSPSGALTPVTGSPFALPISSEKGPFSVFLEPRGLFAYLADQGSNDIADFEITATSGVLINGNSTLSYGASVGSAPKALVVDPTGNFVYVANSGANNVSAYSTEDPGGTLTSVSGSPFVAGTTPSALATDPLGKFLYVANTGSNNVSAYSIGPTTGTLTQIANSPFATGTKPSAVAVDYSGSFLYVTNSGDNTVSEFIINQSTGALSPVPAPTATTGTNPQSIVTTGTIQ